MPPCYLTTPIYYVNDRPHIGHCYTTLLADVAARFHRLLRGVGPWDQTPVEATESGVFFLTGTDEHADKVVTAARERGLTPQEWADRNAAEFRAAFDFLGCRYDDFIRTTEARHKDRVVEYIAALMQTGDIYRGEFTGWYDEGAEEYVTETVAKERGYRAAIGDRPLVRRTEPCYFFRLSRYQDALLGHIERNPAFILPDARRSEVLGRLRQGLHDVPVSRPVTSDPATQWGIRVPGDPANRIYVWIDALFNYLSAVDTPQRRGLWPATAHLIGKDILWFHAVVWPALLMALGRDLPRTVFGHGWWVADGQKMSKSLGNFVDLERLKAYAARYGLDALRWYLATQGPLSGSDADFSHAKFVEVYNADLANGIGNCASRVATLIAKNFDGKVPDPGDILVHAGHDWPTITRNAVHGEAAAVGDSIAALVGRLDLGTALSAGINLVRTVDGYLSATTPWKLAKAVGAPDDVGVPSRRDLLAAILYHCAEAIRVASVLLSPAMPGSMERLWERWDCAPLVGATLAELSEWRGDHSLRPGQPLAAGEPLFMRADPAEPPPAGPEPARG